MRGLSFKKHMKPKGGRVAKARSKPGMSRAAARQTNRSPELRACEEVEPTRMPLRLWVTKAKALRACQYGLSRRPSLRGVIGARWHCKNHVRSRLHQKKAQSVVDDNYLGRRVKIVDVDQGG